MLNRIRRNIVITIIISMLFTITAGNIAYAAGKPAISKTSVNLLVGKTYSLSVKNKPAKATYVWASDNTKIAAVSKNGLVKGIAKGTATITCNVKASGKTYSLKSTVHVIAPAKAVTVPDKDIQLKAGKTVKLSFKLSPSSSNDKITWSSDNKEAATVDSTGKVTAVKVGIAHITASAMSGKKATVSVAVYDDTIRNISINDIDSDGNTIIKDQVISNLYIENTVQKAQITLDNVLITGTLTLEAGTEYMVKANNSTIASAKIVSPEDLSAVKDKERPTLIAGDKADIWEVSLQASSELKEVAGSDIRGLVISPETDGNYDMYVSAYKGNLKVNYASNSIARVEMEGCTVNTADIIQAAGDYMILTSNVDMPSNIKTVNLKATSIFCIDAETDTLNIDKSLKKADLIVANKVNKLVNNGADISFTLAEEAYVGEIIDKKNSNGICGSYRFSNSDMGNFSFDAQIGGMLIEGIQMKDFVKILDMMEQLWTDKTKPFIDPNDGAIISYIGDNTYEFNFNGAVLTIAIDTDAGTMKIGGSDILKITNIQIAKD